MSDRIKFWLYAAWLGLKYGMMINVGILSISYLVGRLFRAMVGLG
jgi:hypothetical protein